MIDWSSLADDAEEACLNTDVALALVTITRQGYMNNRTLRLSRCRYCCGEQMRGDDGWTYDCDEDCPMAILERSYKG